MAGSQRLERPVRAPEALGPPSPPLRSTYDVDPEDQPKNLSGSPVIGSDSHPTVGGGDAPRVRCRGAVARGDEVGGRSRNPVVERQRARHGRSRYSCQCRGPYRARRRSRLCRSSRGLRKSYGVLAGCSCQPRSRSRRRWRRRAAGGEKDRFSEELEMLIPVTGHDLRARRVGEQGYEGHTALKVGPRERVRRSCRESRGPWDNKSRMRCQRPSRLSR